jgi:nucleoside-specific outer membrane channel protein Tsx
LSDKAKSISDAINANNQKASTKEMLLLPVIQVAEEILTVVKESRKSPDEITAMWHNKQFNRIAMYLIEISPHINLDDYLMKQKNIILSKV